ncbi:MAG: DUF456 domain-containing protein [Syntrophales bacterium]
MTPLEIAGLTVFILVLFMGIFSIVFGIPGTAVIFIDVILYALITGFERVGIKVVLVLLVISILAEAIDFSIGVAGAARFGISRRVIWISTISGFIGAVAMTPFLLGLGTVAGIFLGGFAGVLAIELIHQSKLKPALRAGYAAILGRVAGTLVKGFCALVMIVIAMSNIYS